MRRCGVDDFMATLIGIHPVWEALEARRPIDHVMVARGTHNPRVQQILDHCRRAVIPVRFAPREALDRAAGSSRHQGVVALAAAQRLYELQEVITPVVKPGLLVLLDGVEDPHNLGAIIRSAYAAGADAVILPQRRSAGLTETVAKVAAGALEHLRVARVTNLTQALEDLKLAQYWIFGLEPRAGLSYDRADYGSRTALVLGGEGRGLHKNTASHCDWLVKIPMSGRIASLNVSVAAGIVLFEVMRQRRAKTSGA